MPKNDRHRGGFVEKAKSGHRSFRRTHGCPSFNRGCFGRILQDSLWKVHKHSRGSSLTFPIPHGIADRLFLRELRKGWMGEHSLFRDTWSFRRSSSSLRTKRPQTVRQCPIVNRPPPAKSGIPKADLSGALGLNYKSQFRCGRCRKTPLYTGLLAASQNTWCCSRKAMQNRQTVDCTPAACESWTLCDVALLACGPSLLYCDVLRA